MMHDRIVNKVQFRVLETEREGGREGGRNAAKIEDHH
jgi:hypothetical protein